MCKLALALLLGATATSPASAKWREASTKHFLIYSEESAKTLADFATKLEKFDKVMRMTRGLEDPPLSPANRLTIFIVPSTASVQKLYGRGGGDVGGFYMGRATGSVAIVPRARQTGDIFDLNGAVVLFHEYAHHFMMQNFPAVFPPWFIEGFAEFHSTAKFEKDGMIGIGLPANHRAYSLTQGKPMPMEKLVMGSVSGRNGEEVEQIYGRGWLLTHYLTFEPTRKGQLRSYLAALNEGKNGLDAAKAAFGDLKVLDSELNKYMYRPQWSYQKINLVKVNIPSVTVRDLSEAEDAVMDLRIKSKRGVDEAGAKALVPRVRKAAAPYPDDVLAQVTLAEAEYDAGFYAEAEAAADRALKTDPKATEALIYKGRSRMELASAAKTKDPAVWRDVRKWFVAANRIDPEDPEPLMLFYTSFMSEGRQPTANAAIGLVRALELAPQDDGLRWMVAQQHLRDKKGPDARAALAPIAFAPHGGKGAEMAASIIAKLDGGGVEEALKTWESLEAESKTEKAD